MNCFIWKKNIDRLPTASNLQKRDFNIISHICCYCEYEVESIDHVLIRCPLAAKVWEWIFRWCDVPLPNVESIEDMVNFSFNLEPARIEGKV